MQRPFLAHNVTNAHRFEKTDIILIVNSRIAFRVLNCFGPFLRDCARLPSSFLASDTVQEKSRFLHFYGRVGGYRSFIEF